MLHAKEFAAVFVVAAFTTMLTLTGSRAADSSSHEFLKAAIQGNIAEVQLGELAQINGDSEGVKSFGRKLVADHRKGREKSTALAKSIGIEAPTEASADAKAQYKTLADLKGAAFDAAFVTHMVHGHEMEIKKYETASRDKDDTKIAAYAHDTLATLKAHLATAQSLEKKK